MDLMNSLNTRHENALRWFYENAGKEITWPNPLDGFYLANKAKGIHKPAELTYALSVRQSLKGPYQDSVRTLPSGNWQFEYAQEGTNVDYFTNRGLFNCLKDGVPVGVFIQTQSKPTSKYKILGLGRVVKYQKHFFTIEQWAEEYVPRIMDISNTGFDPKDERDSRRIVLQSISQRQGQPAFRQLLLAAYAGSCAISRCHVEPALEAAHILPYQGLHTNHIENGILLRSDIHTLFDLGLCHIDPERFTVHFHSSITDNTYTKYEGSRLLLPQQESEWPNRDALHLRRANLNFEWSFT